MISNNFPFNINFYLLISSIQTGQEGGSNSSFPSIFLQCFSSTVIIGSFSTTSFDAGFLAGLCILIAISKKSSNALELLKFEWKLFIKTPGLKLFWNIPPKWSNCPSSNIEGKSKNPKRPNGWFCLLGISLLPSVEWAGTSLWFTKLRSKISPTPLDPLKKSLITLCGNAENPSCSLGLSEPSKLITKSKNGLNWFLLSSFLSPVLGLIWLEFF